MHNGATRQRYGQWQTIYDRYSHWRRISLWDHLVTVLLAELHKRGMLDTESFNIDATYVRASRSAAGARKKRLQTASRTNRQITHSDVAEADMAATCTYPDRCQ